MRTASIMTGSRPVITPRMTLGIESMKRRKVTFLVIKLTFEMIPTTATGIDLIKNQLATSLRRDWASPIPSYTTRELMEWDLTERRTHQKIMVTTTAAIQAIFLMTLDFHVMPVLVQTTSSGLNPMTRGAICSG